MLPNSWAWIFKPIGTIKPDKNLNVSLQLQSMANIRSGNGYIIIEIYAKIHTFDRHYTLSSLKGNVFIFFLKWQKSFGHF